MPAGASHPRASTFSRRVTAGVWHSAPMSELGSHPLSLFRCLLPSWRFFDQVETLPVLRYRAAPHGAGFGDWQDALTAPPRTPGSLFSNPAGNLHLACRSLVERLLADLEDITEIGRAPHELVSYRLVCALVERLLNTPRPAAARTRYQFCLVEAESAPVPLFLSRVHDV